MLFTSIDQGENQVPGLHNIYGKLPAPTSSTLLVIFIFIKCEMAAAVALTRLWQRAGDGGGSQGSMRNACLVTAATLAKVQSAGAGYKKSYNITKEYD